MTNTECIHGRTLRTCPSCQRAGRCPQGFRTETCPHCPGGRLAYLEITPGNHGGDEPAPDHEDARGTEP